IITMPTVAAALWQGSMGTFMAYSAFGTVGASSASPGPQGQPPGSSFPQQRGNDGPRGNDQTEIRDLSTARVSGVSCSAPVAPAPGSRGIAPTGDPGRVV
ncbi:hypothetical protein XarbCFBP8150_21025, partial [Xanthomonas arboricola]